MMTIICLEPTGTRCMIIFRDVLKSKAHDFSNCFLPYYCVDESRNAYYSCPISNQIEQNFVYQISILSMVLFVHNKIFGYAG